MLRAPLLALAFGLALPAAALAQPRDLDWQRYSGPLGTSAVYPAAVFSSPGEPRPDGLSLATADRRAQLAIFASANARRDTPRSFLRREFPHPRSVLTYDRVSPTFFAVSARLGDNILYSRCNFAQAIHCIELRYPAAEKRQWDGIVTRISRSLMPLR